MKKVVGIATMEGREETLLNTIASLKNQADYIHVYNNAVESVDYADNAKFIFLKDYHDPVYYFSCDDDLIYPFDYVEKSISSIEKYNSIISYHGRILLGRNRNYYKGHKVYHCLRTCPEDITINIAGTGVTAFRTDYFNPVSIYKSKYKKMADIVFSYEAAIQRKKIMLINHNFGWIKYQDIPPSKTIHGMELKKCENQNMLTDKIWDVIN